MSKYFWKPYGVAGTVNFTLYKVDGIDFRTDAVFVAGDMQISKDEGAAVNVTNLPVDRGNFYSWAYTASEATARRLMVTMIDSATKVWLDDDIVIETYGNGSAGIDVLTPPSDASLCAVALYPSVDAVTNGLTFVALPNQSVGSRIVDTTPIVATVVQSTTDYYVANLVRQAAYKIISTRFAFTDTDFTVPNSGTCDLSTVLEKLYVR